MEGSKVLRLLLRRPFGPGRLPGTAEEAFLLLALMLSLCVVLQPWLNPSGYFYTS